MSISHSSSISVAQLCLTSSKNTGVGCHFLLQGIFPTQGLNPGLPHYRQILSSSEPPFGKNLKN